MKIKLTLNENVYKVLNDVLGKVPVHVVKTISERHRMYDKYGISHHDVMKAYLNVMGYIKYNCDYFELDDYDAKVFETWLGDQGLKDSCYIKEFIETEYSGDDIDDTLAHLYGDISYSIENPWYIGE